MPDPTDLPDDDPAGATRAARRRFLKGAGALVAAAALGAAADAADAATAAKRPRPAPKPAPAADPFAAARPDVSLCRTPEERATLEKQWKGALDVVKIVRDTPLDPATEPATVFAALPRDADPRRSPRED